MKPKIKKVLSKKWTTDLREIEKRMIESGLTKYPLLWSKEQIKK